MMVQSLAQAATVPPQLKRTSLTYHLRKSRPIGAADKNIVVEIPDRRLARTGVLKHVVGASAAVKVGHCYHRNRLRGG